DELLRQVGLDGFAARAVDHLSGGEAQRVAFARALANSPTVLLLDEPTSALDDLAKRQVETVIRDVVRASHLTCLMVTHDTEAAVRLADRILVLEGGKVKRIGPLREVLDVEATRKCRSAPRAQPGRGGSRCGRGGDVACPNPSDPRRARDAHRAR